MVRTVMTMSNCKVCGSVGHGAIGGVVLCPACIKACAGDDAIMERIDRIPSTGVPPITCLDCGKVLPHGMTYLNLCDTCSDGYDWDAIEHYLRHIDNSLVSLREKRSLFRFSTPGFWSDILKEHNRFRGHCCRCSEIVSKGNMRTFDGGTIWLCGECANDITHGREDITDASLDSGNLLGLCSDSKSQQIHRVGFIMNQILLEVNHV